jgi:hypothetical protein
MDRNYNYVVEAYDKNWFFDPQPCYGIYDAGWVFRFLAEVEGELNQLSTNRAADGEHGAETNYAKDLMKANSLIFGKILGYIYYGQEFRQAVVKNNKLSGITGKGDVFQYCNWFTPILRMKSKRVECGIYASDNRWGESVRKIYNTFSGNEASNYEQYLLSLDKSVTQKIAASEGIKLPNFKFKPTQNGNDSRKNDTNEWSIVGER